MTTTVSGTYSFNLAVDDLIDQAMKPIGAEHTSGIEAADARRALNLVLIMLSNKGIPISKLLNVPQVLTAGVASYTLSPQIADVLQCTIMQNQNGQNVEFPITRYGLKQYWNIPVKTQSNRPNTFATERLDNNVVVHFWPVPNNAYTYTANLFCYIRIDDITASYQTIDLPYRFLPLLVKWLSYELSLTRPSIPEAVRMRLEKEYKECMPDTFEEDRERADFYITPGGINGR